MRKIEKEKDTERLRETERWTETAVSSRLEGCYAQPYRVILSLTASEVSLEKVARPLGCFLNWVLLVLRQFLVIFRPQNDKGKS